MIDLGPLPRRMRTFVVAAYAFVWPGAANLSASIESLSIWYWAGEEKARDDSLTPERRSAIIGAFNRAKVEFEKALASLSSGTDLVVRGLVAAGLVSLASALLTFYTPWSSGLTVVGLIGFFSLSKKFHNFGKEQAMFRLIPARYALAFEGCATEIKAAELLQNFLNETTSIRPEA